MMTHARSPVGPVGWALAAGALAAALFALHVAPIYAASGTDPFAGVLLYHAVLPRAAMALIAGAALGLSGLLLQRVLRNPIADPSTLGVAAGAQLALVAATLFAPALVETGREAVAFAGGSVTLALVVALNWRRKLEPVGTVLSGMLLSLVAASLSAALTLANGEYVMSIFIWGGGALAQESWWPSLTLGIRVVVAAALTAALLRPLTILGLSDDSARSLGLGIGAVRLAVLGVAVFLATSVTALVGIIGFVGLAAPNLARAGGARTPRAQLIAAPLVGALMLWLADGLVLATTFDGRDILPTGALTALVGGPVLLWMLPRLRLGLQPGGAQALKRLASPMAGLVLLAVLLAGVITLSLCLGRTADGWQFATGDLWWQLLQWRGPRVAVTVGCGALLAASGFILQRVTGNPMASPEVLGISSGAGLGLALLLLTMDAPSPGWRFAASVAGALVALGAILLFASRNAGGPERLLLAGIAFGSCSGAAVTAVISDGGLPAMQMLEWLSGSLQAVTPMQGAASLASAFVLIAPIPFLARWLTILPLGAAGARSLGIAPSRAGGALLLLAALTSAAATLHVGPLSFAGLIGPHIARQMGFARPIQQCAASVLIGAILLAAADWAARMLAFPYQLPVGLFASLLGGSYLVYLISRQRT